MDNVVPRTDLRNDENPIVIVQEIDCCIERPNDLQPSYAVCFII